ncbi:MAG TPA: hypothetical protein VEH56_08665 [Candidatus Saccharimonadales bacterium]|nr:hypothetical protein [Candidatus Saccharimonadales bacterium]
MKHPALGKPQLQPHLRVTNTPKVSKKRTSTATLESTTHPEAFFKDMGMRKIRVKELFTEIRTFY